MASTTFSNGTLIEAAWMNDVNDLAYEGVILAKNSSYAPVGNGSTDDTTAIQNLLNAASTFGASIILEPNKTYAVTFLTIPAKVRLITNGSSFVDLNGTTSNTSFITIQDDVQFDDIVITIPTTKRRDRVINITGDRVKGQYIRVTSVDQQANNSDTADTAIKFNSCDGFSVDYIEVINYDRAINVESCNNFRINSIYITSYVRGVLVTSCKNGYFGNSLLKTASPNASVTAGHNGLLCQSETSDYTQENITFENWAIQDAGEHAVRCGGDYSHRGMIFRGFRIRGHGGCGIKVLGTDLGAPSEYNETIWLDDCLVEDGGTSVSASENRVAFMMEYVKYGKITNCIARGVSTSYTGSFACRLNGCEDIQINDCDFNATQYDGIILHAEHGNIIRISISNVKATSATRSAVSIFVDSGKTVDDIYIHGLQTYGSTQYGFVTSVTGTLTDVFVDMVSRGDTLGAVSNSSANVTFRGASATAGAPGWTAANGSLWQDLGTNIYKRTGGAWATI